MPFCRGYGGIGASISIVVAYVLYAVTLTLMVKKYTNYKMYPKLWKTVIAFVIAFAALYGLNYLIDIHGLILLAISGIMCEAVFLVSLNLMHELDKKDIMIVLNKLINDED